jgi:predicted metal-dependent hydrolase
MSPRNEAHATRTWTVGGIPMLFERRNIKNLRIGIYAPHGEVRVAAPLRMDEGTVRNFITARFGWIVRHRTQLERRVPVRGLQFESGETHYLQGQPLLLEVSERAGRASLQRCGPSGLRLCVAPGTAPSARRRVFDAWYRREMRAQLQPLLEAWQSRLAVEVAELRIRQMKTRWGSCNARARRVCLNLDLARRPTRCLEYVLVHELVHFFERRHNARFYRYMDQLLPHWRACRAELNRSPDSAA